MKMNLGCGPDLKYGWLNVDNYYDPIHTKREVWDMRGGPFGQWVGAFDHVLVNHVFCTMTYDEVEIGLQHIKEILKDGGTLEVIDMDPIKAFRALERGDIDALPGFDGSIDNRFCRHLIGFGRKSLWTPESTIEALQRAGFTKVNNYYKSENDLRPKESLVVKGIK